MKSKFKLKIQSFQHISFDIVRNGKSIPKLGNSIFVNNSDEPAYENEMPLSKALQNLIETKTIGNSIRSDDRADLLAYMDSILSEVQSKRLEITSLEDHTKTTTEATKKKFKP